MHLPFQKLNASQVDRLSEVFGNLGLVFFASLVLPVFAGLDSVHPLAVVWGLILAFGCVFISLIFLRNRKKR